MKNEKYCKIHKKTSTWASNFNRNIPVNFTRFFLDIDCFCGYCSVGSSFLKNTNSVTVNSEYT